MLRVDQVLSDRYQLKRKLGQNMGRPTWLARDLVVQPSKLAILKVLAFGGDVQWQDLKLFEREAEALKQLNHARIPKYLDYFAIDDRSLWFVIVREYILGQSLKELLNKGKNFSELEIRKIATEVLQLLSHLHLLNPPTIHRNIKPSNIIWGEDNQIYLVDFKAVQNRAVNEEATFPIVGTYGYTPVEQFGGRAVPASDLYALGATLIHLLTGTAPADLPQQRMQIQFRELVSVSPALANWIQKLTAPAIEERFETAQQALAALPSGLNDINLPVTNSIEKLSEFDLSEPSVQAPPEILGWNWGAFLLGPFWALGNRVWIGLLGWLPLFIFSLHLMVVTIVPLIAGIFTVIVSLLEPVFLFASMALYIVNMIALGLKGNMWSWQSISWRSVGQFRDYQRGWAIAGFFLGGPVIFITFVLIRLLVHSSVHIYDAV